ncbi:MAG: chromate transporter [Gracilibacteraceae bacterium]|jgi:chromate transporter|nr:chromate transporter [Gracilibacteraceae bacterium]
MAKHDSAALRSLFLAFFRASNFSYGGGPAMIPLMQAEIVKKYKWMSDDEFADVLAIANSLPAPIGTKMSGIVGYRVAGWLGAFVATTATLVPTALIMIFLGSIILGFADSPQLQAMLQGVRPVVVVLLAQTAFDMGKKSLRDKTTWAFGLTALAIMLFLSWLHPAFLVVTSMLLGMALFNRKKTA